MNHILSIVLFAVTLGATIPATAQAQKTPQKKDAATAAQQKKEPSMPGSIKDVLAQYVGKTTNLGTLKRITGDYFVIEEDGNVMMHPLSTIHTLKLVKDEEKGEMKLEIRLVAKD